MSVCLKQIADTIRRDYPAEAALLDGLKLGGRPRGSHGPTNSQVTYANAYVFYHKEVEAGAAKSDALKQTLSRFNLHERPFREILTHSRKPVFGLLGEMGELRHRQTAAEERNYAYSQPQSAFGDPPRGRSALDRLPHQNVFVRSKNAI